MTVYTQISENQVVNLLSKNTIGELEQYSPLLLGLTNSNYHIQTTQGDYILTIFEYVDTDTLQDKLEFEQFLAAHNFPCNPAILSNEKTRIQTIANKKCKISSLVSGAPQVEPDLKQCFAVGELLAELHHCSEKYDHSFDYYPRNDTWLFDQVEKLMTILPTKDALLLQEEMGFQHLLKYNLLPKGIIHANCFTRNVLFENSTITGLFDFYYVCEDYFIVDLAIAINSFAKSVEHQFDEVKVTTILDGYQRHRSLNAIELEWIEPMRRTAALKIWIERLFNQYFPGQGIILPSQDPDEYKIVLQQLSKIPKP